VTDPYAVWLEKVTKLCNTLNTAKVFPRVSKSVVTLHADQGDNQTATPYVCEGKGYVDEHPEGSDRGGYVPFWEVDGVAVYWYDEWCT
jgi:hypothetical protein